MGEGKVAVYESVKASYNASPNGADFVFLSRSCYGGVIRFRQADGYMSTPCGAHEPVNPSSFGHRIHEWRPRVAKTDFVACALKSRWTKQSPAIWCSAIRPIHSAKRYSTGHRVSALTGCCGQSCAAKSVAFSLSFSIDDSKKSGDMICDIPIPHGLFEREVAVNVGRSMLKRFQMEGQSLEGEIVADRLLLTY